MTEVESPDFNDIHNPDGSLKDGVQIIDCQSGEVVAGATSSTPAAVEEDEYLTSFEKHWKSLNSVEREKITRSDYKEVLYCLKQNSRWKLLEHLRHQDRRRIVLLREHLLQISAYNADLRQSRQDGWIGILDIVFICTRLMSGDTETDSLLPDDHLVEELVPDSSDEE
jgi:hypothetical protein